MATNNGLWNTQVLPTLFTLYEKKIEAKSEEENRELKAGSSLNVNSELTLKESFHHGVAVPLSLDDYEKELAREKDLINKAKKKIAMESSTPKEGISTWILLSGSSDLKTSTTTSRPEPMSKPSYRVDNAEKKHVVKNNISNNGTTTTKKRNPVTQSPKTTKPTQKVNGSNKLVTRVKVSSSSSEEKNATEVESSTVAHTTKKPQLTTKAVKKYSTAKPKTTLSHAPTTKKAATTTTTTTTTSTALPLKIIDDSMVIDDEKDEVAAVETSTYLIMEAKDDEFNLPNDRAPTKSTSSKKTSSKAGTKTKQKKKTSTQVTAVTAPATNSTKIKKKSDKIKTGVTKVGSKKPEKPITTQIYNYLAREVMPTVGVGIVGLVVTAGLATYFLGGPLTALRRSYDIASRRDDVAFDRSDDFGNMQDEGEMFGKVIAGMPENSAYRNNIRVNSYRVKGAGPQYTPGAYPAQAQYTHVSKYGLQAQPVQTSQQTQQQQQQQQQYLRYRAADPYYNSYNKNQYLQQQQYYQQQQQMQGKSSDYVGQPIQSEQKFNIDAVDMTTSEPSSSSYSMDYEEIAQSYFPQPDQSEQQQQQPQQQQQMTIEQQNIQEVESKPQPQYVQPTQDSERSEKVTIVNAQSVVPSNHKGEGGDFSNALPTPEALRMTSMDDEYQNSIANAILSQNQKQKQFVVGTSIIAENFEDNSASGSVPEHGPRRRRKREARKPAAKSLENNEIDEDDAAAAAADKNKRQTENETQEISTTNVPVTAESSTQELSAADVENETTTQEAEASETTTTVYDINGGNNVFQLFRRIIELKLRLGLNFLQNATLAFQEYLKGVEERVQTSPLFNPYANATNTTATSRKSSKVQRKKVENL